MGLKIQTIKTISGGGHTLNKKTVLLIGAFDTKGKEYAFVKGLLEKKGFNILTLDIGVIGEPDSIEVTISSIEVAILGGESLESLKNKGDRGHAMTVMSKGASKKVKELHEQKRFDGVLGMGGTGGTSVISAALKELPVGVPKVLVSTAASGDTRQIIGTKDILLLHSVVDVAGLNSISEKIYTEAAGAISGMLHMDAQSSIEKKPIIAVTMFGNTTECVERCRENLEGKGFEVLVFHCTGTGGKTMESLVEDGLVKAVLDITTTEWADELCGGVFSAGPSRLEAAGKKGIPHLIVPGCVDMVNFGTKESIPEKYKDRQFHVWNPQVTLMRTTPEENKRMGEIFAEKANFAKGPTAFLIPLKGVSILDSFDNEFWWPEADQAIFAAIKQNTRDSIDVEEIEANINDEAFSNRAVEKLLELLEQKEHANT